MRKATADKFPFFSIFGRKDAPFCIPIVEALPGGGSHVARLNFQVKRLVSVFINVSRRCRKLNENSLSLSEF